jgi:hypothetical protein
VGVTRSHDAGTWSSGTKPKYKLPELFLYRTPTHVHWSKSNKLSMMIGQGGTSILVKRPKKVGKCDLRAMAGGGCVANYNQMTREEQRCR